MFISVMSFQHSVSQDRKSALQNKRVTLDITVKSIPSRSDDTVTFVAKPNGESGISECVFVTMHHARNLDFSYGDRLTLSGVLSKPEKPLNPGGFDYGNYIKSLGASMCFYTDGAMIENHSESLLKPLYTFRDKTTQRILENIAGPEAGLVNALVTGNKDLIPDSNAENYRKSGIYHIVAVSGLHLNILILFFGALFVNLKLRRKSKNVVFLATTIFCCVFMLLFTGLGVSVTRVAFMSVSLCAAGLFYREYTPFASLFVIFAILITGEPSSFFSVSLWLSFFATGGILAGSQIISKLNTNRFRYGFLINSLILTQCANLATIPFLAYYFGGVSVISPITNIIVIALCPLLLGFSYIFTLVSLFGQSAVLEIVTNILSAVAYSVNFVSDSFAKLPFSYVDISLKTVIFLFVCAGVVTVALRMKNKLFRVGLILPLVIANFCILSYNITADETTITFINASQGDCSLITSSDGTCIMIDCGSENYGNFGENSALPYLKTRDVTKLDLVFITHFHSDHTNGISHLMEKGYVKCLVVPDRPLNDDEILIADEIYKTAARHNIPIHHVNAGCEITVGSHNFTVLSPQNALYPDANDGSMVIHHTTSGKNILYTGDIQNLCQYNLIEKLPECDIVKVPHHGAKSSMSYRFAEKIGAEYAVISCGINNIYSHPDKETLNAYKKSKILRTDLKAKPIIFTIKENSIIVR